MNGDKKDPESRQTNGKEALIVEMQTEQKIQCLKNNKRQWKNEIRTKS